MPKESTRSIHLVAGYPSWWRQLASGEATRHCTRAADPRLRVRDAFNRRFRGRGIGSDKLQRIALYERAEQMLVQDAA
ncbi:MAG TPA: hypothetical protein VFI11_07625, partial [Anaerolineales bacterium]|nr:hypothetical protein [Anaerolineales bacterium]